MKALTIYLGSKCNMNCAYCHRVASEKERVDTGALISCIRERGYDRVSFFGGEPLLYMDAIKTLVAALPNVRWRLITNGTLLKEHLPFLIEHKFILGLSNDGAEHSLRGDDGLNDPLGTVLPGIGVSSTLYHGNTNVKGILRAIRQKGKKLGLDLHTMPHLMHYTSETNAPMKLTASDIDSLVEQFKEIIVEFVDGYKRYGVINGVYQPVFNWFLALNRRGFSFGETYCSNARLHKCDATGQMFDCLYVRDFPVTPETLMQRQGEWLRAHYPQCETCEVYGACGGACVKSLEHGQECRFYKSLYTWFKRFYAENEAALKGLSNA